MKKAIEVMSAELNSLRPLDDMAKTDRESAAARREYLVEAIETLESELVNMSSNSTGAASSCGAGGSADLSVASSNVYIGHSSVSLWSFSLASRATSIDHSMFLEVSTNGPNYWDWSDTAGASCTTALYTDLDGEFNVEYGVSWIYEAYGETTHFLPGITEWTSDTEVFADSGEL